MNDISTSRVTLAEIENLPQHLYPSLFTSAKWLQTLLQEYNFELFCTRETGKDNFLIAAKIQHFGFTKIKLLPFCDYIIPSAENTEIFQELVHHLKNEFPSIPIEGKLGLPNDIKAETLSYPLQHTAYRHTVDTSRGIEKIQGRMDNSFLRGVRKAESEELSISITENKDALNRFYEIYCKQRISKFGKLPQPYTFF
jgi:hypothetical protein